MYLTKSIPDHFTKRFLFFGGFVLLYTIAYAAFVELTPETIFTPTQWIISHYLTDALFISFPLLAVNLPFKKAWLEVCGRFPHILEFCVWTLGGFLLILAVQTLYYIALAHFGVTNPWGFTQSDQFPLAFYGLAVVVGPLGEEVYFRGFLRLVFKNRWVYIIASAAIWAAVHTSWTDMFPLLFMGMVLAYMRVKTGSIYAGLLVHATMNFLALFLYFAS